MSILTSSDPTSLVTSRQSRRTVLALAFGVALGSVGVPAGLAAATPKPKRKPQARRRPNADAWRRPKGRPQRRPRYKVVTRTFSSAVQIKIPDSGAATPYPATIQVGGLRAGTIQDVNVILNGFSHTFPEDLEVILVAPSGQVAVVLMSDAGGGDEITNATLVFDDQAARYLPHDQQLVSGSYRPTLLGLAPGPDIATQRSFNGLNPRGTWRLYVADGAGGGMGSIAGWALTIKVRVRV